MDGLLFARLQFGLTTLYHFFFVPVSISLAVYLAIMQTAWYRTGAFPRRAPTNRPRRTTRLSRRR
jgi:cytochrome bd-type quinol oxidase subunit 1